MLTIRQDNDADLHRLTSNCIQATENTILSICKSPLGVQISLLDVQFTSILDFDLWMMIFLIVIKQF